MRALKKNIMRKCPKCSSVFDDTWKVCLHCETSLVRVSGGETIGASLIDDVWVINQTNILLKKCQYAPRNKNFLLEPDYFYKIANPQDQFAYLMKRHDLPIEKISVYLHGGLEKPGKVEMVKEYDTKQIKLEPGQTVVSIKSDGKATILDMKNKDNPKMLEVSAPLSHKNTILSVYLCQDYISQKEVMAAIIAHEFAHLYLYFRGLQQFTSTLEIQDSHQEYITDIVTFVLGLGSIMLNGCIEKTRVTQKASGTITECSRVGYLSYGHMQLVQEEVLRHIS